MTDTIYQVQLLRLADCILGFREADAFRMLNAVTPAEIASARATLGAMVDAGKLRRSDGRYYRVRAA